MLAREAYRGHMFEPLDANDPLNQIPSDDCPECRTVLQDYGCRNCGWVRPAPPVTFERPTDGDDLPSIGRW